MSTLLDFAVATYIFVGFVWFFVSLFIFATESYDKQLGDPRVAKVAARTCMATWYWPIVVGRVLLDAAKAAKR